MACKVVSHCRVFRNAVSSTENTFELWCCRRLLRVLWTARRSNQSILKEINAGYSLKAETPKLWPLEVKNWPTGKDPNAGKDWGQEEKGATEDEMVRCYHWLNGHEFEQTAGDSERQGSLACCSPWGLRESDTIERLKNHLACPPYVPIKRPAQMKLTTSAPVFTTMLVLLF